MAGMVDRLRAGRMTPREARARRQGANAEGHGLRDGVGRRSAEVDPQPLARRARRARTVEATAGAPSIAQAAALPAARRLRAAAPMPTTPTAIKAQAAGSGTGAATSKRSCPV